jgi:hypothetical protein
VIKIGAGHQVEHMERENLAGNVSEKAQAALTATPKSTDVLIGATERFTSGM